MFVVTLKFSKNKDRAGELLDRHRVWIQRGFDQGLFLMAGRLQPDLGGAVLAHNTTREALEAFVREDIYVAEDVVTADILEITPVRFDDRLQFMAE